MSYPYPPHREDDFARFQRELAFLMRDLRDLRDSFERYQKKIEVRLGELDDLYKIRDDIAVLQEGNRLIWKAFDGVQAMIENVSHSAWSIHATAQEKIAELTEDHEFSAERIGQLEVATYPTYTDDLRAIDKTLKTPLRKKPDEDLPPGASDT